MNVLINNFTPYFPHLKGVKVGKGESETLVFGRFEKPLEATTTKKKKKKKKTKAVAEEPVVLPEVPKAEPVVTHDVPPI